MSRRMNCALIFLLWEYGGEQGSGVWDGKAVRVGGWPLIRMAEDCVGDCVESEIELGLENGGRGVRAFVIGEWGSEEKFLVVMSKELGVEKEWRKMRERVRYEWVSLGWWVKGGGNDAG